MPDSGQLVPKAAQAMMMRRIRGRTAVEDPKSKNFHSIAGIVALGSRGKITAVVRRSPLHCQRRSSLKITPAMKYLFTTLILAATLPASASVVITYAEDADAYHSSLSGTSAFDFDSLSIGRNTNVKWSDVGTFDQLYVKKADSYGGAPDEANPTGSLYSLQGAGTSVLTTTLFLNEDSSYFGMWWSAGDSRNVLSFYDGDNLVSRFTTASLMQPLPADYDGNPMNRKVNSGEPYAFINFFGDEKTPWDRIVLTNDGSSGFESDNYTTRVAAWDPLEDGALPGVPVAIVSGETTTLVTEEELATTRWSLDETTVASAPGAPVPPWSLLVAFGAVFVVRKKARATV